MTMLSANIRKSGIIYQVLVLYIKKNQILKKTV